MKKILILGSTGMVGSSIKRNLNKKKYKILAPSRSKLDLLNNFSVTRYFNKNKPQIVVLAAGKVGGIYANNKYPADFIHENITIQNNVISSCNTIKNLKLIFLGSSCIYPRNCKQPIKEDYLLTGPLEKTNEAYAIAKISGIKMIQSYKEQYKKNYIAAMPTNIYGYNDNFHSKNSHVVAALIKKINDAKLRNKKEIILWGTGKPLRDLLFVDDLARAIIILIEKYNGKEIINIGSGKEISIKKLAFMIQKKIGYNGKVIFNKHLDGTPRKILDISKLKKLKWKPSIPLSDGLDLAIDWYKKTY
jgi:GDP-L-fucose synthase